VVLVVRGWNPERDGIGEVNRCANSHSRSFRQEETNPMGGVVALSSRVLATLGWMRQHRTSRQGGYSLSWSVSLKANTPAYAPKKMP